jgi:hypothetical protein
MKGTRDLLNAVVARAAAAPQIVYMLLLALQCGGLRGETLLVPVPEAVNVPLLA